VKLEQVWKTPFVTDDDDDDCVVRNGEMSREDSWEDGSDALTPDWIERDSTTIMAGVVGNGNFTMCKTATIVMRIKDIRWAISRVLFLL